MNHRGTHLCRKMGLALCLISVAGLLASCVGDQPTATVAVSDSATDTPIAVSEELVLLDWSGYDLPEFRPRFDQKNPDAEVNYSYFADDAEAFAKAQSGFEFDVVHPCINFWRLYVETGMVQPIDTSRISNWENLYPDLAKQGEFDGKQYFIPYEWGYDSILVRTDKVKEVPDSWADLWDPQYAGHLALFDSGEINHVVAAIALGLDPWNTTPEQDEQITQKLLELKPNVLTFWADYTDVTQLMAAGDIWVAANAWNDAYSILLDQGVPVEYITPKEGRLGWVCGFGISSEVKNLDLAYDYIDAMLDAEPMAAMMNAYAYGGSSPEALTFADPDMVKLLQVGDPAILQNTIFYQGVSDQMREVVTKRWSELKAAP